MKLRKLLAATIAGMSLMLLVPQSASAKATGCKVNDNIRVACKVRL